MDHYFRLLDMEVRRQLMPAPYDKWQTVILWLDSLHFALLTVLVTIAPPKVEFLFISSATSATCKSVFVLMF